jgi:tRNA threonylcarbamoyl adenosine modification protein YeaZ
VILAIDTSAGTSVAVVHRGEVLTERVSLDTMAHAEVVGMLISECLAVPGISREQITHVAAGMGPGPFTGLRVGIAAAQAFAWGLGVPLLPVVSHDAIAAGHVAEHPLAAVQVVTDARRKESYVTEYAATEWAPGMPVRTAGPQIYRADELPDTAGTRVLATEVSAAWLGLVAEATLATGAPFPPCEALYLRSPDVTLASGPKRVSQWTAS